LETVFDYLQTPVPIWSLVTFRVAFGAMMFLSVLRFWLKGWIIDLYVKPQFFFTYYGFEWVKPLGETGMYGLFLLCGTSALGILFGFYFRVSAVVFFLTHTYIELIDKTTYLNHYYFVSLTAFLLIFTPANAHFSIDAFRKPSILREKIFRYEIGILRLQMGLLYFFAGVAKIHPDWLAEAQPLRIWLRSHTAMPVLGQLFEYDATAYVFSWSGMIYDLLIPFALLYARTRIFAYIAVVVFHSLTAMLFPIGMFPYIMMVCTLVFFTGESHEKFYAWAKKYFAKADTKKTSSSNQQTALLAFLGIYFLWQVLMPFRYALYSGDLFWTEEGFRFSWRVMLVEKAGYARFFAEEPSTGRRGEIDDTGFLTVFQRKMMSTQPDMILQYAHYLAEKMREKGIKDPKIFAEVYVTLNGRPSRLLIDPKRDLSKEEDGFAQKDWILP
jgi:hypothetical protein